MELMSRPTVFFCFLLISTLNYSAPPKNFGTAKKMASQLFAGHKQTLYCQCTYDARKAIDLKSCGMESAGHIKRAQRLEWEHIVAAENFGRHFQCWREPICMGRKPYKGRKCCQKIEPAFREMEAELYNLWPSVGLVNGARSNYRFAMLGQDVPGFYGCAIKIDKKTRSVEPPGPAKGIVARASLFVEAHYGINLSSAQKQLFMAWNKQFPPTAWEKEWAYQVYLIEGYHNPFIEGQEDPALTAKGTN